METQARRTRVGLIFGRAALQTLWEGFSYLQIEEKLLSLHLFGLDIGSMNNSVKFIEVFVDSMASVMDTGIRDHIYAIDKFIGRKRLFAFAADKVH